MTFKFSIGMRLWILCLSVLSLFLYSTPTQAQSKEELTTKGETQRRTKKKRSKNKQVNFCDCKIKQGIKGTILFSSGNLMPSPDKTPHVAQGVKRRIALFEVTTLEQVETGTKAGFYSKIATKKWKETESDAQGCFILKAKVGRYSLFVWEKGEWYANSFGPNGEIFEVEIKENEVTPVEFSINHAAVY